MYLYIFHSERYTSKTKQVKTKIQQIPQNPAKKTGPEHSLITSLNA